MTYSLSNGNLPVTRHAKGVIFAVDDFVAGDREVRVRERKGKGTFVEVNHQRVRKASEGRCREDLINNLSREPESFWK